MTKNIIGFMLVDAPHSALNNAGTDAGERTDNVVKVKAIRRGKHIYPYVSGQAVRYWWRETLQSKFTWKLSPISRKEKIAFTAANPVEFEDDDVMGYMRALKDNGGGTVTRLSPLKNSPLVSVISNIPTNDFGVMARHEGDPVPYEHEFYSTILKGIFSIDLNAVGVFYAKEKTGYKNMYPDLEKIAEKKGVSKQDDRWVMPKEIRIKRAKEVISALPYLSGGAKQTPHLTDVSPKFLVLAVLDSGNHIFMNLAKEENREAAISIGALKEAIEDYSDCLLTDIYIGRREGFMDELDDKLKGLVEEYKDKAKKYLFSWNDIPEIDSKQLVDYLLKDLKIDWAKDAKINKIDNGKTVTVIKNNNSLELKLNENEDKVILKTGAGKNCEYLAKEENGKINIYTKEKKVIYNSINKIVDDFVKKIPDFIE